MGFIHHVKEEFQIIQERDPSIKSPWEVLLYPSFKVMLTYHADHISVLIEDDGKGFDMQLSPNKNEDYSGFGLRMMKERVYLLSGKLEITSREDCGTKILVRIPVSGEEE